MKFLDGYKTYIAAVYLAVLTGLEMAQVIDRSFYDTLYGLGVALGLYGMRDAVKKLLK